MPRGNNSYEGENELHSFAITEPASLTERDARGARESDESSVYSFGVAAKEPDRQSTTRRGSPSSRARSSAVPDDFEGEASPRTRSPQRRATRRSAPQARRSASDRGQTRRRSSGTTETKGRQKKSRRGFAAMSPEQQREIARKGGLTVSRNRRHMADIGRVGGEHSHGGRRSRR